MQAQQAQIDALKQQLADRDAKLATASQDAQAANASAAAAAAQAQSALAAIQSNHDADADAFEQRRHRSEDHEHRPRADDQRYQEGHQRSHRVAAGDSLQGTSRLLRLPSSRLKRCGARGR